MHSQSLECRAQSDLQNMQRLEISIYERAADSGLQLRDLQPSFICKNHDRGNTPHKAYVCLCVHALEDKNKPELLLF